MAFILLYFIGMIQTSTHDNLFQDREGLTMGVVEHKGAMAGDVHRLRQ